MSTKTCINCKEEKPIEKFHKSGYEERRADCQECRNITNKKYYIERKKKEFITCECGLSISKYNKDHMNTKKHIKLLNKKL